MEWNSDLEYAKALVANMDNQAEEEMAGVVTCLRELAEKPGADPDLTVLYAEGLSNLFDEQFYEDRFSESYDTLAQLGSLAAQPGAAPETLVLYCHALSSQSWELSENNLVSAAATLEQMAADRGFSPELVNCYTNILFCLSTEQDPQAALATLDRLRLLSIQSGSPDASSKCAMGLASRYLRGDSEIEGQIRSRMQELLNDPATAEPASTQCAQTILGYLHRLKHEERNIASATQIVDHLHDFWV